MRKIGEHLYEEAGLCPQCGKPMRRVRYFVGKKGDTTKVGPERRQGKFIVQSTSTEYNNLQQKLAGFWENCDRAAFEEKENNWPKPGKGLLYGAALGAVCIVAALAILLYALWKGNPGRGAIIVAVVLFLPGLGTLWATLTERHTRMKEYEWHQAGNRNPYPVRNEELLSLDVVKTFMMPDGKQPPGDTGYFDLGYVKIMSGNPHLF